MSEHTKFEVLQGQYLLDIVIDKNEHKIEFFTLNSNNEINKYVMEHRQDCCESVYIKDIVGDIENLKGQYLSFVEESFNEKNDDSYDLLEGWTFYKIGTEKEWVDITWEGSSNGYYSLF